jgi:hypothetical protein
MNFDLGTLSGVLGVILTVVFFAVGYRQTIGARKERAGAANREILETLLRRFTLDSDFSLRYNEIEKFITGKALDNRVKRSDIFSIDEIYPIVYSRVVSSDYISASKRKSVLEKLGACFKPPSAEHATLEEPIEEGEEKPRKISLEALLGFVSALTAAVISSSAYFLATEWIDKLSSSSIQWPLLMAVGVTALTALVLVVYVRLRERAATTKPDVPSLQTRAQEFEARTIERLKAIGVSFTTQREIDLILELKAKRVAVELKLYPPLIHQTRAIIQSMRTWMTKYGCQEGYLVFAIPVPQRTKLE